MISPVPAPTSDAAYSKHASPARPTLERMLDELGSTFLTPLTSVQDASRRIGGAVVFDPLDDQAIADGAVILGVGLSDGPTLRDVLARLGSRGASAFVLREPVLVDDATVLVAREHDVALLGLTRGASWTQLSAMVSALLTAPDESRADTTIAGLPGGDLFTLANAVGALLNAPITIEDRNSRVLAFSSRQGEADLSRIETILERQVPEKYSRLLAEAGFFKELYSSEEPVFIELRSAETPIQPRVAVAVRAGDEILGSIWAAVPGPLSTERTAALREASKVVALHLLSIRAGADVTRRMRADLLSTALEGGEGAAYALERLGISDEPVAVFAAGMLAADDGNLDEASDRQARRQHVADAIAVHLAAVHPRACAALLGGTIYGLLPVQSSETGEAQAARLGNDFVTRIGRGSGVAIGIGRVASGPRSLVSSRDGAERALRVLQEQASPARVALFSDVHVESLLLEMRDRFGSAGEQATGPVARLFAHDKDNDTEFIETLRVWLDSMGDVSSAAEHLHIHPNTFRYRLRRLAEVGDMDLTDADVRFAAQLQLRIVPELVRRGSPLGAGEH
ncbi:PucR family transcriptional regulator [Microbacterium murale]|uniref:PucR family transcriptional regulator n=1 Tax=Microbacterium murale TaxID=1081040 RepID=A0ABU0P810_9MICO|nr:PucR family transcriptional regulator [Microbacterium murale]MDQ0643448.1 hypothetical protein [Microbacterium murale]